VPDKSSLNRPYSLLSKVWNLGFFIVFLTLLGYWLDKKLHTFAVLTLAGATLGLTYCFYEAWRALNKK
jgi:hypothetical protein